MKHFKIFNNQSKPQAEQHRNPQPPEASNLRYLTRISGIHNIRYFMEQMMQFHISVGSNLNAYPCTLAIAEMPGLNKHYIHIVLADGTKGYFDCDELDKTWRLYMS